MRIASNNSSLAQYRWSQASQALQAPRVDCTLQRNLFNAPDPCVGAGSDTRQLSSYFMCDVSACRDAPMFLALGGQKTENKTWNPRTLAEKQKLFGQFLLMYSGVLEGICVEKRLRINAPWSDILRPMNRLFQWMEEDGIDV